GGPGADDLIGNGGRDTASYATRTTGVVLDLNGVADDGNASDASGGRRDALGADIEVLTGGTGADQLRGDATGETLDGGPGADTYAGRGGIDTVTYAGRLAGVTVDIGAGTADDGSALDQTGSRRDDVQADVEALIGGRDADTLIGDGGADRFTTRGDGLRDVVLCGGGTDLVTADALDLLPAADCETVNRG
ncbi:MAG TPA: hypothetical protein VF533_12550, partial [Solirubrobacteraceae bacterium]